MKTKLDPMLFGGAAFLIVGIVFLFMKDLTNALVFLSLAPALSGNGIDLKTAPRWVTLALSLYLVCLIGLLMYDIFGTS